MARKSEKCAVFGQGPAYERTRAVDIQPLGRVTKFRRREWFCDLCEEPYLDDEQAAFNDAQESEARAKALRDVAGADLRTLRELVGVTQVELEAMFGLGKNTVARWGTGQRELPGYIAATVRLAALHPSSLRELAAIARVEAPKIAPRRAAKVEPAPARPPSRAAGGAKTPRTSRPTGGASPRRRAAG